MVLLHAVLSFNLTVIRINPLFGIAQKYLALLPYALFSSSEVSYCCQHISHPMILSSSDSQIHFSFMHDKTQ